MAVSFLRSRIAIAAWIAGFGSVALALLVTLLSAVVTATILVDRIPGGDAGLATTPALDSAYRTMNWSFPALVGVVAVGVAVPLIVGFRRRRAAVPQ